MDSNERRGTGGASKLDGAGPMDSGLSGGSSEPIRPTATGAAATLANSYICCISLSGRRKMPGSYAAIEVTMGGPPAPGVPQEGESANRPRERLRIGPAADDERPRRP